MAKICAVAQWSLSIPKTAVRNEIAAIVTAMDATDSVAVDDAAAVAAMVAPVVP